MNIMKACYEVDELVHWLAMSKLHTGSKYDIFLGSTPFISSLVVLC